MSETSARAKKTQSNDGSCYSASTNLDASETDSETITVKNLNTSLLKNKQSSSVVIKRLPLSAAERQRRYREKKKALGEYESFKAHHAKIMKIKRDLRKKQEKLLPKAERLQLQKKRRLAIKKRVAEFRKRLKEKNKANLNTSSSECDKAITVTSTSIRQMPEALIPHIILSTE